MSVSVRSLLVALLAAVALSAAGCGDTAADNKSNPALGEPSKDGPPKRSAPGSGEAKKQAEEAMKNAKSDIDFAKAQGEFAAMAAQIAAITKLRQRK